MGAAKPQTDRELLLSIHLGLYGDGNGTPGFFRETRGRLDALEKTMKERKTETREWVRILVPLAVAATPGVIALVTRGI